MPEIARLPAFALRRAWLAVGGGFVLLVIYLSLTPDPIHVDRVQEFNIGHALAYMWLMFWFCHFGRGRARLWIGLALVGLGIGLEFAQAVLPWHRTFGVNDMRDDAIGVIFGWISALSALKHILPAIDRVLARALARK